MFNINPKYLGNYDVAVCGGGVAGVCAAVSAGRNGAKVILIESGGCLGGTMTEGTMPLIIDRDNKGGIVKEIYAFLDKHNMSCARRGAKIDENGNHIPGDLLDIEGAKYFFDMICKEAGVNVLFHSKVAAADHDNGHINSILISTDCGLFSVSAKVYIDATGNGLVADMAGCEWECGEPSTGLVSPASIGMAVTGMPAEYNGTDSEADKLEYGNMLKEYNITTSSETVSNKKLPALGVWDMSVNFQYGVQPDDIESLSNAVYEGRKESFDVIEKHKKIPGYEKLYIAYTSAHIGIREGRRIFGEYRLCDDDILEGRRFEDAVCLVTAGVDVHKLKNDDTLDCGRGYRSKPYHIPYRCLLPIASDNMLLAGRCLSGDFYPHASYRMMGNMSATGEAAGYAAAVCAKENIGPKEVDGKKVSAFMRSRGYQLD